MFASVFLLHTINIRCILRCSEYVSGRSTIRSFLRQSLKRGTFALLQQAHVRAGCHLAQFAKEEFVNFFASRHVCPCANPIALATTIDLLFSGKIRHHFPDGADGSRSDAVLLADLFIAKRP